MGNAKGELLCAIQFGNLVLSAAQDGGQGQCKAKTVRKVRWERLDTSTYSSM